MRRKIFFTIVMILLAGGLTVLGLWSSGDNKDKEIPASSAAPSQETAKITVAACPTCYPLLRDKLSGSSEYNLIPTGSTGESIHLLTSGKADMILAGRKLKPEEPDFDHLTLEDGYSFLSDSQMLIYKEDLPDHQIFTDLDPEEIRSAFSLPKVTKVDDVYKYLDQGVVITSWNNTDYSRADIVHIYEKNGERVKLSRSPTLYCSGSCDSPQARQLISIINNN